MKQFLLIALVVALAGCSKHPAGDDVPPPSTNAHIGFATTVLSKGASTSTETITNFGVFGYRTADKLWTDVAATTTPDLFDNVAVSRGGSAGSYTWSYAGQPVNWGEGFLFNFTFFGYSPMATVENKIVAPAAQQPKVPIIGFEALDNVGDQIDLLAAQVYDTKATAGPVMMKFGHALCRIGFKAFSKYPGIKVQSIAITGVKYKGTLALSGEWNSEALTKDFTLTYPNDGIEVTAGAKTEGTAIDISAPTSYFMMLPQYKNADGSTTIVFSFTTGATGATFTKKYIIQEDWEMGKAVSYTVDLTTVTEADLKVTKVDITDWTHGETTAGGADGEAKKTTLTYANADGTVVGTVEGLQNSEIQIAKTPEALKMWSTKTDGTGFWYGVGDKIKMSQNITLYQIDNTVTIGALRWMRSNLSGTGGSTEITAAGSAHSSGQFFKWGSTWVYQSTASITDGMTDLLQAANPLISLTKELGYDYVSLIGGRSPGDPCVSLNANFKTPTMQQFLDLDKVRNIWGTYRGVSGRFFGLRADECSDGVIQPGCIFLPAAGYRKNYGGATSTVGSEGRYWVSSAPMTLKDNSWLFSITKDANNKLEENREAGLSVRCVGL